VSGVAQGADEVDAGALCHDTGRIGEVHVVGQGNDRPLSRGGVVDVYRLVKAVVGVVAPDEENLVAEHDRLTRDGRVGGVAARGQPGSGPLARGVVVDVHRGAARLVGPIALDSPDEEDLVTHRDGGRRGTRPGEPGGGPAAGGGVIDVDHVAGNAVRL